eukprot:214427_1
MKYQRIWLLTVTITWMAFRGVLAATPNLLNRNYKDSPSRKRALSCGDECPYDAPPMKKQRLDLKISLTNLENTLKEYRKTMNSKSEKEELLSSESNEDDDISWNNTSYEEDGIDDQSFETRRAAKQTRAYLPDEEEPTTSGNPKTDFTPPRELTGKYKGSHDIYGEPHGEGTQIWNNGDEYRGSWDHGKMHGRGIYKWRMYPDSSHPVKKSVNHGDERKSKHKQASTNTINHPTPTMVSYLQTYAAFIPYSQTTQNKYKEQTSTPSSGVTHTGPNTNVNTQQLPTPLTAPVYQDTAQSASSNETQYSDQTANSKNTQIISQDPVSKSTVNIKSQPILPVNVYKILSIIKHSSRNTQTDDANGNTVHRTTNTATGDNLHLFHPNPLNMRILPLFQMLRNLPLNLQLNMSKFEPDDTTNTATGNTNNATSDDTTNTATGNTNNATSYDTTNTDTGNTNQATSDDTTNTATGNTNNATSYDTTNTDTGNTNQATSDDTTNTATGNTNNATSYDTTNTDTGNTNQATSDDTTNTATGNTNNATSDDTTNSTAEPWKAVYTGEWIKHKRHGVGEMKYAEGVTYVGEWQDGLYSGFGKMAIDSVGKTFHGKWVGGQMAIIDHKFKDHPTFVQYVGQFHAWPWIPNGTGRMLYKNGDVYEGDWCMGKHNGHGIMLDFGKQTIYEGVWIEDKRQGTGFGTLIHRGAKGKDIEMYNGQFKDYKKHGLGAAEFADGRAYKGEWRADVIHGEGIMLVNTKLPALTRRLVGSWKNGKRHGEFCWNSRLGIWNYRVYDKGVLTCAEEKCLDKTKSLQICQKIIDKCRLIPFHC